MHRQGFVLNIEEKRKESVKASAWSLPAAAAMGLYPGMTSILGYHRALRVWTEIARHRSERMPSALELFGFGSEDEPPSPV